MRVLFVCRCLPSLLFAVDVSAQTAFVQLNLPDGPGWREHAAITYDEARAQTVVFGGLGPGGTLDQKVDTWLWDGAQWTEWQAPPATPTPGELIGEVRGRLIYDSTRTVCVLLRWSPSATEHWEFDGTRWHEVTAPHPDFRSAATAFDRARGRIVLFGSESATDASWEWDGTSWRQMTTATIPSGRTNAKMAYDPSTQRIVMYGGQVQGSSPTSDTWEYDGAD